MLQEKARQVQLEQGGSAQQGQLDREQLEQAECKVLLEVKAQLELLD
jgi:hypothetical protein